MTEVGHTDRWSRLVLWLGVIGFLYPLWIVILDSPVLGSLSAPVKWTAMALPGVSSVAGVVLGVVRRNAPDGKWARWGIAFSVMGLLFLGAWVFILAALS